MSDAVGAIERDLAAHVRAVLDAAVASPAGGGPGWDAILVHYRVTPAPALERAQVAEGLGLLRGAAPGEVLAALRSVVAWADAALAAHPEDGRTAAMRSRLATLPGDEIARYESLVRPPLPPPAPAGAPSLGSIFANAAQTAKEVPWAKMMRSYDPAAVLHCIHCGAPQQAALDFLCRFCKRPMVPPATSPST